jgi:hypothetical protein
MNKQNLLQWTEYAVNWLAGIPPKVIICAISLIGLMIGALLILNPLMSIEIQRIIYAKMNWKIEPISLPKEVRNLRLLGLFMVIFLCATLFLVFFSDLFFP